MTFVRAATAMVMLGGWCAIPLTASADELRALVVAPQLQSELLLEALSRVKGELTAAGFQVRELSARDGDDGPASITHASAQDPGAAIVVVREQPDEAAGGELVFLVYEPWEGETSLVRSSSELPARRGAVQAVELLRAVLEQRGLNQAPQTPREPAVQVDREPLPSTTTAEARARAESLFDLGVGVGLLSGFEGAGSRVTPVVRLSLSLPRWSDGIRLQLRASAAGLGQASSLRASEGQVTLRQSLLSGELVLRGFPRSVAQPMVSVGGGAYGLAVDGEADAPFEGRSKTTWSGLLGVGAGLWLQPMRFLAASLEAQLLSATAPTEVRIAGRSEATAGAAMLLLSAQLAGSF